MWIKICGITSLEDAMVAVDADANAVGFVFAASPRRVTPEIVREITSALPFNIEKIGVFVDSSLDEIVATFETAGLTGVQLHGEYSPDHLSQLRMRMKKKFLPVRVIYVVPYDKDSAGFARRLQALAAMPDTDDGPSAVLVDTRIGDKVGGTGIPFDWGAAQAVFHQHAANLRLIAAGGLHPENVRQAIHTMQPWGVDVCSGVECVPGRKDHQRVKHFIRTSRAAGVEFQDATQR
ncbi:MAG TPA: phosphoribosylanthranilate isomerase [Acidobacteriaceae bacterium]|nr:phosphoribosylanthranilate isomerase [Acidobacteriaceae bacterium]